MTRHATAVKRRVKRLMRPAKPTRAAHSFAKAVTGLIFTAALAPITIHATNAVKPHNGRSASAGRSLGAVLNQLHGAHSFMPTGKAGSARREVRPRIPEGAQYLVRTHRGAAGSRGYKLYVPASQPTRPNGLIVMLHGCDQTPDDFAVGTRMNALAERHGLAVAYPAQIRNPNGATCWNWFKPANQSRGAGEPAILASLTRKLMREFGLGRDDVFVAGLSAGGAMAAILADVYPDVFSAAGIHSGLARAAARDTTTGILAMRRGCASEGIAPSVIARSRALSAVTRSRPVRRIVFQGTADSTVHPSNAAIIVAAALGGAKVPTRIRERTVAGRGYARSEYEGPDGAVLIEFWMIDGAGHAWSGGRAAGSFTDSKGPDASAQMVRFFLAKHA